MRFGTDGPALQRSIAVALAFASLVYASASAFVFRAGALPRHRVEAAWFIAALFVIVALGLRAWHANAAAGSVNVQPSGDSASRRRDRPIGILALFVVISCAVYVPSLNAGLFSDDFVLLERAQAGTLTMGTDFFRPAPLGLWWISSLLGMANPLVLHAFNVVAHGVNAWLVYLVGRDVQMARAWALAAAALFVVNPSSVEAVTWVSGVFDVLMVTGTLAFVLSALRGRAVAAFLGLALALLSKETGVVAAFLGLGIAWLERRRLRIPLMAVAATALFVGVRVIVLPTPEGYAAAPSRYLLKELASRSFGSLALPWSTADLARHPVLTVFPWLTVAIVAGTALIARTTWRSYGRLLFLACWVIVSVAPVYSYFFVAPTLEGSRYLYPGSAGFSLLVSHMAGGASRRATMFVTGAAVGAAVAGGVAGVWLHQEPWRAAAATRDALVASARNAVESNRCSTIEVVNLPDSHDGAYVFRNGFPEALVRYGIRAAAGAATDRSCRFEWDGTASILRRATAP